MHLARQLVSMGYLKQDGEYRALSLTPKALESLKKRAPIFGVMPEAERVRKKEGKKEEVEYNHALFAILRQKRKELADEAGVPPYVIFSDKTLVEMAAYLPQSTESLLTISGVGQVKLRQYGEAFLEVVKSYTAKHGLKEKRKEAPREKSDSNRRYVIVAEAFNAGETVEELMRKYGVTVGTILDHLARHLAAGNALRKDSDLQSLSAAAPDQQQTAFAAFDELGPTYLKPVYDKLNGALNYDELKILRLLYLIANQE
jgi:ATP-dependent DNA helicase RecQ